MIETAYAKINLALHVRARRADGYHEIETLFAFAENGDLLRVMAADDVALTMTGRFAGELPAGGGNLVVKAGRMLRERAGISTGAKIHLVKNLPVASGIGGGSADAAAALRLLTRFWHLDEADDVLLNIAASLGADVPACVSSRPTFGSGTGADLRPADQPFANAPLLLVNPLRPLATAPVFAGWDGVDRGPLDLADPRSWRNDLAKSAVEIVPEIGDLLSRLERLPGTTLVRMSGSGATCFALFETDVARDTAASAFPDMWTLATRLR